VQTIFDGLGQALRWLRDRQAKKQYQVADAAGITKGMLSAYETGRQRPSLETLEKLLNTLECDLNDLHNALQLVNGRPQQMRPREGGLFAATDSGMPGPAQGGSEGGGAEPGTDLYRILGIRHRLPAEEERALSEMLAGYHRLIRYLHRTAGQDLRRNEPDPDQE
jgi:transcriptional regulator with XRE-family HTH domain